MPGRSALGAGRTVTWVLITALPFLVMSDQVDFFDTLMIPYSNKDTDGIFSRRNLDWNKS